MCVASGKQLRLAEQPHIACSEWHTEAVEVTAIAVDRSKRRSSNELQTPLMKDESKIWRILNASLILAERRMASALGLI